MKLVITHGLTYIEEERKQLEDWNQHVCQSDHRSDPSFVLKGF